MYNSKTFKIVTFLSLILVVVSLFFLPTVFYLDTLQNGISLKYLKLESSNKSVVKGRLILESKKEVEGNIRWEKFHFNNFEVMLPIRHPEYSIVPHITGRINRKNVEIGVKFLSYKNNREYISLLIGKKRRFIFDGFDDLLFEIPLVKNRLKKIPKEKILRDLFSKNLIEVGFTSYFDMIYNLYIMKLRQVNLSKKVTNISYWASSGIGVQETTEKDKEYTRKIINLFDEGISHSLILRFKKGEKIGSNFRKQLLENLSFKKTTKEASRSIYVDYRTLSLDQRIDQEGMTYLFMAYSHVINNKEFLRYMIQFLEKGKDNLPRLVPLYKFSFDNYDTNFSNIEKLLREKGKEMEKRKMEEEFKNDAKVDLEYNNEGDLVNFKGDDEEKMDYYLQNAKEEGSNLDDNNDYIIVD